jgi:hypothetical protein
MYSSSCNIEEIASKRMIWIKHAEFMEESRHVSNKHEKHEGKIPLEMITLKSIFKTIC